MNIASAQMLQESLQNLGSTLGRQKQLSVENAFRQSQLEEEKRRTAVDQSFRDAQMAHYSQMEEAASQRANAESKRLDLANQAHIQADVSTDDGQKMTFTGTPDQLEGLVAAAKQQGKTVTVSNKKDFAAQFNVGGAQFSFSDQGSADKFATEMKQRGIDVYAPQQPNISTTPGGQELVTDAKGHVIKGAPPAMQTQTVKQVPAPIGSTNGPVSLTNTVTRVPAGFTMPTGAAAAGPSVTPPASHIAFLQAHPEAAADFDAKYGAGASSQYLKPIPGGGGLPISMPDNGQ